MLLIRAIFIILILLEAGLGTSLWASDIPAQGFAGFCERVLINSGLLRPAVHAKLHTSGELAHAEKSIIKVQLAPSEEPTIYARTNRSLRDLLEFDPTYPSEFMRPDGLLGKKILDLACGDGRMVEQLRRLGVDIVGLDIYLTPYQMSRSYFVRASGHDTGLPAQSFDIVFSSLGPFFYMNKHPEFIQQLYREVHRILKPGGVLRISGINLDKDFAATGTNPEVDLAGTAYWPLPPGLRIKNFPKRYWFTEFSPGEGHLARYWLEIERVD